MTKRGDFINESFKFVALLENSGEFIFEQGGLTMKNYGVLYLISTGVDTSKDLLNGTYGSKPNMAKKLKILEDSGFISRNIDEKDKRIFRFSLTLKANEAIKKITPLYDTATALIFFGIKDEEIDVAINVIKKCLKNFGMIHKNIY